MPSSIVVFEVQVREWRIEERKIEEVLIFIY
jgi:hypothetical protein